MEEGGQEEKTVMVKGRKAMKRSQRISNGMEYHP
jgi:hypothetical protein